MNRRGRPPHPDVLTPREWEVLALLREGLSDQAIADRLSISLDGAKYHVREILSKLGVASRQEAAAWQPEQRAPTRRWLVLPLALRVTGALVVVAAVGGLGVLAWGVLSTGDSEDRTQPAGPYPATPEPGMRLTRDQALLLAGGRPTEAILSVDVQASGLGAIQRTLQPLPSGIEEPPSRRSTAAAWLVTTRGMFNQFGGAVHSVPPGANIVDEIACREVHSFFPDDRSNVGSEDTVRGFNATPPIDDGGCHHEDLTRDLAIVVAGRAVWTYDGETDPPVPTTAQMTLGEAFDALRDRAVPQKIIIDTPEETPVWLVTLAGRFQQISDPSFDGSQEDPATVLSCADRFVILDIASHNVIYSTWAFDDPCD